MITASQRDSIRDHAYVPEHVLPYGTAISRAEPFLIGNFLGYVREDLLIFIGYPLWEGFNPKKMGRALEDAIKRFRPDDVAITAPEISSSPADGLHPGTDYYYRLDLPDANISQKTRNMIHRAGRELTVERVKTYGEEHQQMIVGFLEAHPVDKATRTIFERIGDYVLSSDQAWIFNARNKDGKLVAFDVAEFWASQYAFYMFNFSSENRNIPGASDLILSEVIQYAERDRKAYINLGLGINPGVTFFKKKWGGVAFLPHASCFYSLSRKETLETLLQKL